MSGMHFVHLMQCFRLNAYRDVFSIPTGKPAHKVHEVHFLLHARPWCAHARTRPCAVAINRKCCIKCIKCIFQNHHLFAGKPDAGLPTTMRPTPPPSRVLPDSSPHGAKRPRFFSSFIFP